MMMVSSRAYERDFMKKILCVLFAVGLSFTSVQATETNEANDSTSLIEVLENGDVKISETDDELDNKLVNVAKSRSAVNVGVVNFAKTSGVINYTEESTGRSGYISANSGADGAYLGTVGNQVRFKQAGVIGLVDASLVQIASYDDIQSVNFYRVDNGRLRHYITTNLASDTYQYPIDLGPKQSYMQEDTVYYSYDAHYFYTTFEQMIYDYQDHTYRHSINADTPYYNYFQYLSHRTKTNFTADQFNERIAGIVGDASSVMIGKGSAFMEYQNTFGSNALLMFGVAANESSWGRSRIALLKNNLFGHNAYDSNPEGGANGYTNSSQSIWTHAKVYVSTGYVNPADWRYFGPELGDKASGMNVKYASDPYWGEKAASQAYYLEMDNGNRNIDYGAYTIGVKTTFDDKTIYSEPTRDSSGLYTTGTVIDFPFTILETVTGESIDGNDQWYKIQSDAPLSDDRTSMNIGDGEYNMKTSYAYVHSAGIRIVFNGKDTKVSSVTINPTSATISVGKSFKANAIISPSNASDKRITWRSGNHKVVTVDDAGNIKATGVGRTYVYAKSANGIETKSLITVVQPPVKITLNPGTLTMAVGKQYKPAVILSPSNAATSITWKSGNEKVVKVDEKGTITAIGAGKTYVYATTSNGLQSKVLVSVSKLPTEVQINPTAATFRIGKTFQAKASVYPTDASDKTVYWISENPKVASVDKNGLITAKGAGKTQIIAKTINGKTVSCNVTVLPLVEKLTVNPTSATLKVGKQFQAKAYYSPVNATNRHVEWSSSDRNVISVDENGNITAKGAGDATVTLKTDNGIEATIAIKVVN